MSGRRATRTRATATPLDVVRAAQRAAWQQVRPGGYLVMRAYCTACSWEDVQSCRLPDDVRSVGVIGLDDPRRQQDLCTCGGPVYVVMSRG
jgi:hypothetical protein